MQTRERGNVGADSTLLGFLTEKRSPLPDRDNQARLAAVHDKIHGAVEINYRTDVAGGEFIGGDRLVDGVNQRVASPGKIAKAENESGIQQTVNVLVEPEDGRPAVGGVAANAFKDSVAIVQAGVHDRNSTGGGVFQAVIEPYILCGVCHRGLG